MNLFSEHFLGRFVLRDLSLPSRLAIASFLTCVGIGYFGALMQLHFHHASPGKALPDAEDAAGLYHGRNGMSQLERLLVGDEGKPFNGGGTMRQAFSTRSSGWKGVINRRSKEKNITLRQAEAELRSERDGERLVLLAWIRSGADKKEFEENMFVVPSNLAKHPITKEVIETSGDGTVRAKIGSIIESRCVRCHQESAGGSAAQIPLDTWEEIHAFCEVKTAAGGVSAKKLTQTTHVHLLGFSLLYGLTGLIFTLLRGTLGVLPLLAQGVDIGFWWLARLDPVFAYAIMFTGGCVAIGLMLQILLTLFNLFGKAGKMTLVLMILGACVGGFVLKVQVIDPYLAQEAMSATVED
jgi:hypothetical protein